jgi:hypothetical protein
MYLARRDIFASATLTLEPLDGPTKRSSELCKERI